MHTININVENEIKYSIGNNNFPDVIIFSGTENLVELTITGCAKLKSISGNFPELQFLALYYCEKFEILNVSLPKIVKLTLYNLPSISVIENFNFPSLKELYTDSCVNLKSISGNFPNLYKLCVDRCVNLKTLPDNIGNVEKLICSDCVELESIPDNFQKVWLLYCKNCIKLHSLPKMPELFWFDNRGCTFLDCTFPDCHETFIENVKSLVKLQKFARKYVKYCRFKRFITSKNFIEWIYAPERIGGKLSKKQIQSSIRE